MKIFCRILRTARARLTNAQPRRAKSGNSFANGDPSCPFNSSSGLTPFSFGKGIHGDDRTFPEPGSVPELAAGQVDRDRLAVHRGGPRGTPADLGQRAGLAGSRDRGAVLPGAGRRDLSARDPPVRGAAGCHRRLAGGSVRPVARRRNAQGRDRHRRPQPAATGRRVRGQFCWTRISGSCT